METHRCSLAYDIMNDNMPLYLACENGHMDIVVYLLMEAKCDINNHGETYLHVACRGGNVEVVKLIASTINLEVQMRDQLQRTPLHYASQKGHLNIIKCLVDMHHGDPLSEGSLL